MDSAKQLTRDNHCVSLDETFSRSLTMQRLGRTTMTGMFRPAQAFELKDWQFSSAKCESSSVVRLPHDAMIAEHRDPSAPGGSEIGYFPGGVYTYRTIWLAPAEASSFATLRFEGVQGEASAAVNGINVGTIRSGYTEFEFDIHAQVNWGEENSITVLVDNSAQPSGRWYPGSGLYRPVTVLLRPEHHFVTDGVQLRTWEISELVAVAEVSFRLNDDAPDGGEVMVELRDGSRVVASAVGEGTSGSTLLRVPDPQPWSADTPHLYELVARLEKDGVVVDAHRERVGLRTISVDAKRGLRINGRTELLRGACIHHDNGPLGAATHRAAEYRRIRLLKQAGFNAIRSAHNPMSRELLDACDELGMYVLDELADYWVVSKTAHDFSGSPPSAGGRRQYSVPRYACTAPRW
jgi:beta-galactosidase/beta-glucuronidase